MIQSGGRERLDAETVGVAAKLLCRRDPVLASWYKRLGPPPLWKRPANFATLSRIVIEQQVSLSAAKSMYERLRLLCDGQVTATSIARLSTQQLCLAGLSRQKARYIAELSVAVRQRRFSVSGLQRFDDAEVARQIQSMLGFGAWSADIYLMMALMRRDRLPTGDLGLVKGISEVCDQDFTSLDAIVERAERWRPWRSVATRMIWHAYLVNRGKDAHRIASG